MHTMKIKIKNEKKKLNRMMIEEETNEDPIKREQLRDRNLDF
jgi:hypothetical protein